MTRVLVTGASGFVGGHIAMGLAARGLEVIAVGGSTPPFVNPGLGMEAVLRFRLDSDSDVAALLDQYDPDVIVHAAALADVARCQAEPEVAEEINVRGTKRLLSCCTEKRPGNLPLFLYISTDLVFEGASPPPGGFGEDAEPKPLSSYAKSKRRAEILTSAYQGPHSILRICLTYGPPLGSKRGFMGWLLDGFRNGTELRLFSDEWRTPVHVDDIATSIQRLIELDDLREDGMPLPNVLHIAGETRLSRSELGELIAEIYGFDTGIITLTTRDAVAATAPRARDAALSTRALKRLLGFAPRDMATGLRELRDNELERGQGSTIGEEDV